MTEEEKPPFNLWPMIEPGAKGWYDQIFAEHTAYAKEHGYPAPARPTINGVAACSQAISLKRIADALDRLVPCNPLLKPDGTPNSILDIARQGE